ncbi:MAG: hypothetical protein F6K00_15530 [Leptolyngbya sp. SIOISBB]|nr:hypothetical protein [Leptolyngbya sp. SIOISBB]
MSILLRLSVIILSFHGTFVAAIAPVHPDMGAPHFDILWSQACKRAIMPII